MSKQDRAKEVVSLFKVMSNEARLMMLCKLCEVKEASASELTEIAGVSQPAGSQHLSTLKSAKIVNFRREHNILYYSLTDDKVKKIVNLIYTLYCD